MWHLLKLMDFIEISLPKKDMGHSTWNLKNKFLQYVTQYWQTNSEGNNTTVHVHIQCTCLKLMTYSMYTFSAQTIQLRFKLLQLIEQINV